MNVDIHECGGAIVGSKDGLYRYCIQCAAFRYNNSPIASFPNGIDREQNMRAWELMHGRSPSAAKGVPDAR